MNTTRAAVLMFSFVCGGLGTGCADPWANEAAKLENQNSEVAVRIKASLISEPGLAGAAIDVKIEDGKTVLSGFVETEAQARQAVRIARDQKGVSAVVNRLVVK